MFVSQNGHDIGQWYIGVRRKPTILTVLGEDDGDDSVTGLPASSHQRERRKKKNNVGCHVDEPYIKLKSTCRGSRDATKNDDVNSC